MLSKFLDNHPLFKECLESLETTLLPEQEAKQLSKVFLNMFPITEWGKIDWNKIHKKIHIDHDPEGIIPALEQLIGRSFDKSVYIEWSTGGLPVIKSDLDLIIKFFNDVTCVSFEKFIFNPYEGYVIEILHMGEITVGLVPVHRA